MAIIVVIVAIIVVARLLKTINGWISEPYHHRHLLQVITKYVVYPFLAQSTDKTMIGFEQSFLFLVIS